MKIVSWRIEGMQCSACARTIQARLAREAGVRHAEVTYPTGIARLLLDNPNLRLDHVVALLEQAGYRVDRSDEGEAPE